MTFLLTVKLIAVAVVALLITYFILNATLAFLANFSQQLQKINKNFLIVLGAAYIIGLLIIPHYMIGLSQPIIRIVGKIAPNFLGI